MMIITADPGKCDESSELNIIIKALQYYGITPQCQFGIMPRPPGRAVNANA